LRLSTEAEYQRAAVGANVVREAHEPQLQVRGRNAKQRVFEQGLRQQPPVNERRLQARFFKKGVAYHVPVAVVIKSRQASFERLASGSVECWRVQIGGTALEWMEAGARHASGGSAARPVSRSRPCQWHCQWPCQWHCGHG